MWSQVTRLRSTVHSVAERRAHLAIGSPEVRRQRLSEVSWVGQFSKIELFQHLTVAATSHSHNAILQKLMNTYIKFTVKQAAQYEKYAVKKLKIFWNAMSFIGLRPHGHPYHSDLEWTHLFSWHETGTYFF